MSLFYLQKSELAHQTVLNQWTPLLTFRQYQHHLIGVQLFLLKTSGHSLSFQCNEHLLNHIAGGRTPIRQILPIEYLRTYRKYLIKYNIVYQEQFLTTDGLHVSPWFQFRCRPFAKHITTAKPPKFHKALINIVTVRVDHAPYQVPDSDPVTDITTQYTNRTLQNAAFQFMTNATLPQLRPILLKEPYRTNPH